MTELLKPRERRYTHEDQLHEFPGDLGLEFVAGLQDKQVIWGRGPGGSANAAPTFSYPAGRGRDSLHGIT